MTGADSLGMGEIISARNTASSRRGAVKLLLPPNVESIVKITELAPLLESFRSERESIASFWFPAP